MCTDAFHSRCVWSSVQTHGRIRPDAIDSSFMLMYCLTFYKLPTAVVSTLNNYLGRPILDMFIILYKFWALDFRAGHNACTS